MKEGVPVTGVLPLLEASSEARLRTPSEVASRYCALMLAAFKGATGDSATAQKLRVELGARANLTPSEAAFLDNPTPSHGDNAQFSWGCEAALPLAWALGKLELPRADDLVDGNSLGDLVFRDGGIAITTAPSLRSIEEILDATDLVYRQHWAIRQSRLDGKPIPGGLDPGVVQERHKALNWLTCYGDDWDDVTTDT